MIEYLPDPAITIDGEGLIQNYNGLVSELLGDIPSGTELLTYIGYEHASLIGRILDANRRGINTRFDRVITLKSRDRKAFMVRVRCLICPGGVPQDLIPILLSHTQDEQFAVKAIEIGAGNRLVKAVDNISFTYQRDLDGHIHDISESIYKVTGYWDGDIDDGLHKILTRSEMNTPFIVRSIDVAELRLNQLSFETVIEINNSHQEVRLLKILEAPALDEERKIVTIEGVAIDITNNVNPTQTVRCYYEVLDYNGAEMFAFNKDNFLITEANSALRDNLGYTMAELQSMTPADFNPDIDITELSRRIKVLEGDSDPLRVIDIKTAARRKDGSRYPTTMKICLIPSADIYFGISTPERII